MKCVSCGAGEEHLERHVLMGDVDIVICFKCHHREKVPRLPVREIKTRPKKKERGL